MLYDLGMRVIYSEAEIWTLVIEDAKRKGILEENGKYVIRADSDEEQPYGTGGVELLLGPDAEAAAISPEARRPDAN
jgi:hypothetical protein